LDKVKNDIQSSEFGKKSLLGNAAVSETITPGRESRKQA